MRTIRKRNWLIKRIALGLAIAAFAAPVAQAGVDQGIGVPPSEQSGNVAKDVFVVKTGQQSWPGVDPTSGQHYPRYDMPPGVAKTGQQSWPGVDPTSGQDSPRWDMSPVVVSSTSDFSWRDAGIGAGLAFALVLLGGAAVLASRHVGRAQTV
jgi:hypothetical protein